MRAVVVTGSSREPSVEQRLALRRRLAGADRLHHGLCRGADVLAHDLAVELRVPIVGHPGHDRRGVALGRERLDPAEFVELRPPAWYHDRNAAMVEAATELIGLVARPSYYRSGEWQTIRLALAAGLPVALLARDGTEVEL